MKRFLTAALCCFLALCPTLAPAISRDQVDRQVDDYFKKSRTVGGAVVVTLGGKIVYERYFGKQDSARQIPVSANTYFRVASVTKLVSGIGIMQLVEQGVLDLDEDIGTYFGYPIANTYFPNTPITLRQLMSHTSSLEANTPGSGKTIHGMLAKEERKHGYYTDSRPGSVYAYSNFGAGTAGAIMEAVTGERVNKYMLEHVFTPLSIDASYEPSLLSHPDFVSNLYKRDGTRYRSASHLLEEVYDDCADPETHFRTTVGRLWIRARDLATLEIALCGDGTVNGVVLLSEKSISQMRADQAALGASVTGESPYGLFLQREKTLLAGKTIYGHQGMLEGILCNVYFDPETQFGFVMLTNGCNNVLDNHVGVLSRRMFVYTYENFVNGEVTDPFQVTGEQ